MSTRWAIVARAIDDHGPVDFAYTDEAKLLPDGRRGMPFYKPDWSPERMRSQMYTGHLSVMRRSLVEALGGFREEFEGSQDYDLVLRLTERTDRILHIPEMLYLWRAAADVGGGRHRRQAVRVRGRATCRAGALRPRGDRRAPSSCSPSRLSPGPAARPW